MSSLRGEKPIFGPLSKNNTGMDALRAGLPVMTHCLCCEQRHWMAMRSNGQTTASTNETIFATYVVPDQRSPEGLVSQVAALDSCLTSVSESTREAPARRKVLPRSE